MGISDSVRKLFASDFDELTPVNESRWRRVTGGVLSKRPVTFSIVVVALISLYLCVYYYNQFVVLETRAVTEKAQIEAQLQMRKDLLTGLAQAVSDYAGHERNLFKYVSDMRQDFPHSPEEGRAAEGPAGAADEPAVDPAIERLRGTIPDPLLDRLIALAENYPDLKLSSNFESLMQALVDVEKGLAERRMAYNDACNAYETYLRKFPQNVYAFSFGFEAFPYFVVDDDARLFSPTDYWDDRLPADRANARTE